MVHTNFAHLGEIVQVAAAAPAKAESDAPIPRAITIAGSSGVFNRNGWIIEPAGISYDSYMAQNPVVLWAHDSGNRRFQGGIAAEGLPIGRTTSMRLRGRGKAARLDANFEFNEDDEFGARVALAWDRGFVRAASVGLIPTKIEERERPDGKGKGQAFLESELVEWSLVAIPADPNAVRRLMAEGLDPDLLDYGRGPADKLLAEISGLKADPVREPLIANLDNLAISDLADVIVERIGKHFESAPVTEQIARIVRAEMMAHNAASEAVAAPETREVNDSAAAITAALKELRGALR